MRGEIKRKEKKKRGCVLRKRWKMEIEEWEKKVKKLREVRKGNLKEWIRENI